MMRMSVIAAGMLLFAGGGAFAQSPDGALLAGACAGCHGARGDGSHGIPAIRGMHSEENFIALMRAFRANERPNTVMARIARGYTDAEITALAAYFARTP
jgi:sulfide dehydrogenase cytochrome subunit